MSRTNFAEAICEAFEGFVGQMEELARGMVITASQKAFAVNRPGRRGRPPGGRGGKRAPAELVALGEKFAQFVEDNPGLRIEQINRAIQTNTADLALPIRKLIAANRIRTNGHKRATTYLPGKGTNR